MRYNHPPEARRSGNLRRIAIWNKAKIIFAIAMGIWVADNGIFIYGKYPYISRISCIPGDIIGLSLVNFRFQLFWTCSAYLTTIAPL